MELILKQDVENLGFKDDIVTVKNGYGRNFLIPQGHAIMATPSAKKMLAETLKQRAFKEKKIVDEAKAVADVLAGLEVDASALASTLIPELTSLTTELRDFMPELPALPDINLQSQLSSLSELDVGSGQYNTLLSSITDNFGTALTSAGSSLDSLVSDAASAESACGCNS